MAIKYKYLNKEAVVKKKIVTFLKNLILKNTGELSWSKFTIWLAGTSTAVIELSQQLTAAGIAIPAPLIPYIKGISIISAVIAGLRLRNAAVTPITTTITTATPPPAPEK